MPLMEPKGSLVHSLELIILPYPEPKNAVYIFINSSIRFNFILSSNFLTFSRNMFLPLAVSFFNFCSSLIIKPDLQSLLSMIFNDST